MGGPAANIISTITSTATAVASSAIDKVGDTANRLKGGKIRVHAHVDNLSQIVLSPTPVDADGIQSTPIEIDPDDFERV